MRLTTTRNFMAAALVGIVLALAAMSFIRGAGSTDAGSAVLALMVAGIALTMFSLVPPALRLLFRGWRNIGVGPREAGRARGLADGLSVIVWGLWLAGGVVALPAAWGPLIQNIGAR